MPKPVKGNSKQIVDLSVQHQGYEEAKAAILGGAPIVSADFDLEVAPNAIEWAVDEKFLGFPQLFAHWGQYQLVRDVFQLRCPICNPFDPNSEGVGSCWGKSRRELESETLLVRSERHGGTDVCPKCGGGREEFVKDGILQDYNTVLACIGMRGGKSATAGIVAAYAEHLICCASGFKRDSLQRRLGQAPGTTFDIAFVATTAYQAELTIWDYYTNFRERSTWFQNYVKRIKELEVAQPKTGLKPWQYVELDRSIENGLIGVNFRSLHSNSAGMAGATRIAAFIDELARFDTTESKRGADEVWRVLSASLQTVREAARVVGLPKIIFGLKMATSSPLSVDDKMMTMVNKKASSEEMDNVFVIKRATWEFNPKLPRSAFKEAFAEDAIQAERDFGANPPLTETPLIDDVPRFAKSIAEDLGPSVIFRTTYPEDGLGRQYIGSEVVDAIISPEAPRFVCFDAGESFDCFAGAMGHAGWVEVLPSPGDEDQTPRRIMVMIYDWVLRMVPTQQPKRTIWFDSVVKIIGALSDHFRIARVTFDRWQSKHLIQNIRQMGIYSDEDPLKSEDFVAFRNSCYAGEVKLLPPDGNELEILPTGQLKTTVNPPEMSAAGVAIYELVKLSRDEQLKHVFNPLKGKRRGYDSDDVARVLVGVHKQVLKLMVDDPTKRSRKERLRRETMGGEMWGGGAIVQAMKGWSVQRPTGRPGGFGPRNMPPSSRYRGGVPGYSPSDTWVDPGTGEASKAHTFHQRGLVRMKRW